MSATAKFEAGVLSAFIAAALVVSGLVVAAWKMQHDTAQASSMVQHTYEVLDRLARIQAGSLQIELSTQSFRISGNPEHLKERDASIAERERQMIQLQELTRDNNAQQALWSELHAVLEERIAIARKVEQLRRESGAKAANAYVAQAPLKNTREKIYALIRSMEAAERELLHSHSQTQQSTHSVMVSVGVLASGLLLLLLSASYAVMRQESREIEASSQALVRSEERLSAVLNSIGDAVIATDVQGKITGLNPRAAALTGWAERMALGQPIENVFVLLHETTGAKAPLPFAQALATGQTQSIANDAMLVTRDGRQIAVADSVTPIWGAQNNMAGVVVVFRDVSAERRAQRLIQQQNEVLDQRVRERTAQLRESEEHLQSIINNLPATIAFVDSSQRYVYANQEFQVAFAPDHGDVTGLEVREVMGEERYAVLSPLIAKVLRGEAASADWQPRPGRWRELRYVPKLDSDKQVIGYYALGVDISERKQTEMRIRDLNTELKRHLIELENVSRALKTLSAGNHAMLRASSEQDLLDSMCRAIIEAGGYQMASVWYRSPENDKALRPVAVHGYEMGLPGLAALKKTLADDEQRRGVIARAILSGEPSVVQNMAADPHYSALLAQLPGSVSGIACPLRVGNEVVGALAIYCTQADFFGPGERALLSESADDLAYGIATLRARARQQQTQETMIHLTRHDVLTGLPNEAHFAELLTEAIASSSRTGRSFAVLQANIERLSEINDALGFPRGDEVLRQFALRLRACMPMQAPVARLRGDEFAVLLPDSNHHAAIQAVLQAEQAIAAPFSIADLDLDIVTRIGIALFPEHGDTPHDLLRRVDAAMHQAKAQSTAHVLFDQARNPDHAGRLLLAGELRRAIEHGDLRLHVQPKIDMASGEVVGVEGLVRWQHPSRGMIPPGDFISLAEHIGLIKPLTEWVIEAGMRMNREWAQVNCALPVAINLSARNLHDDQLLDLVRRLRSRWDIPSDMIGFEITESTIMQDAELALGVLHALRQEGAALYMDDFGTGYSSLSYLQKLPVQYIKIDHSFIGKMMTNPESAVIVRSTIDLAHDLERKVVGEGVETQAEWDLLKSWGCDQAQGYFIARPMPAQDFAAWLQAYRTHPPAWASSCA